MRTFISLASSDCTMEEVLAEFNMEVTLATILGWSVSKNTQFSLSSESWIKN